MGNIFNQSHFMAGATRKEFETRAIQESQSILAEALAAQCKLDSNGYVMLLLCAVRVAIKGHEGINEEEQDLIKAVFVDHFGIPLDPVLEAINSPVNDGMYSTVRNLFQTSQELGMAFCNFALCFAYVDGVFEEDASQKLSDVVTANSNIIAGSPDDYLKQ